MEGNKITDKLDVFNDDWKLQSVFASLEHIEGYAEKAINGEIDPWFALGAIGEAAKIQMEFLSGKTWKELEDIRNE
jgi:hypothetical protein